MRSFWKMFVESINPGFPFVIGEAQPLSIQFRTKTFYSVEIISWCKNNFACFRKIGYGCINCWRLFIDKKLVGSKLAEFTGIPTHLPFCLFYIRTAAGNIFNYDFILPLPGKNFSWLYAQSDRIMGRNCRP